MNKITYILGCLSLSLVLANSALAADAVGSSLVVKSYCGGSWDAWLGQGKSCSVSVDSVHASSGCHVRGHEGGTPTNAGQMPSYKKPTIFRIDCESEAAAKSQRAVLKLTGDFFQGGSCNLDISIEGKPPTCSVNTSKYPQGKIDVHQDTSWNFYGRPLNSVTYSFESPTPPAKK